MTPLASQTWCDCDRDHSLMGWLSWFSSQPDPSSTQAPDRSQRKVCWDARDAYFLCLDQNNVLKPGQEQGVCSKQKRVYEAKCAKSWVGIAYHVIFPSVLSSKLMTLQVDYFNKRRVLQEEQKDQLAMAKAQSEEATRGRQ